jgi:sulfate transport system permease protein
MGQARKAILPGFGLSLGYTVFYLSAVVLIPLAVLLLQPVGLGWERFWKAATSGRALAAYRVSFGTALNAATINFFVGLMASWVLVRYEFPGKKILDALVDFPFALPTAVAGVCFATLYSPNGWLGGWLEGHGFHVINTTTGITVALVFIGFPFMVRTIQPVLADFEKENEEAAQSLGANRWQTFLRVVFPAILPSLVTGFTLAFSRGVGEYGSVIFIAGNLPFKTEIAPLIIMAKLDQFDYAGAASVAAVLLLFSFAMLLVLNALQAWANKEPR